MKTIHLIRHAKSSWNNPLLSDRERPLNNRGKSDALLMAPLIAATGCSFAHIHCSPARRAQDTIRLITRHLPLKDAHWRTDPALYTFDADPLLHWLARLDESLNEIMIVGHNPALTDLCHRLSGADISRVPTCAYIRLVSPAANSWQQQEPAGFSISHFLRPRDFRAGNG